jgi:hypothetical protein
MGVRKSGRRRIEVAGRTFVWYVCDDTDSADRVLHVVSEDKRFLVKYHLAQPGEPFLIVIGRDFPGVAGAGGVWRRFRCPGWEAADGVVTPIRVRRLIDWCFSPEKAFLDVNWRNIPCGEIV